jgi:hypothetical protein
MTPRLGIRRLAEITPAHSRFVFAALAVVLLAWTAARVTRAGKAHRAALRDARASLATLDSWRRGFRAPVAAESLAWRRTTMEAHELGIAGDERLALTQAISRAAEAAGLRDVRVRLAPPDTTGSEARLSTEGVRRQPASFSLLVEFRGSLQAVVNLIGQLPPSVAATSMTLVRPDAGAGVGRARHRLTLAVFEISVLNDTPILGSPSERGDSPGGSDGRVGG